MLIGVTALVKRFKRQLDLAKVVEVALGEPGVEGDTEALQGRPHLLQHQLDPATFERLGVGGPSLGDDPFGQLDHVLALVAALGRLGPGHPSGNRFREALDLAAGVVDVVLALGLVPDRLQQPHQGVAISGVAAAADVQWPGRVGRDELDQDPLGRLGRRRAEPIAGRDQGSQRPLVPGVGEKEVDEAGAGDLDPVEAAGLAEVALELGLEAGGDIARAFPQRARQQHRRVGAEVTQIRLRRPVERGLGAGQLASAQGLSGALDGAPQLGDRVCCTHAPIVWTAAGAG